MTTTPSTPGGVIDHSTLVGGSTAARRLECPGSYKMEQKVPANLRSKSSPSADEGSALHDCIAYILENDLEDATDVIGMVFRDMVITQKQYDQAIAPSVQFFDDLIDEAERRGEGPLQFMVEKRCEVPGIPGAFGTTDILFRTTKRTGILDWKFGEGVPVAAIYLDDENGDLLNPQLMFYGRGTQHTFPGYFGAHKDWRVELIIFQPRVREDAYKPGLPDPNALASCWDGDHRVTYAMTDMGYLEQFRMALVRAIAEATGDNPRLKKGEHCRFAACKTVCPEWTGPIMNTSQLAKIIAEKMPKRTETWSYPAAPDFGEYLAAVLEVKDQADVFFKEALDLAHKGMTDGTIKIPGWKLVPKRATERYVNESGARDMAIEKGVDPDDVWEPRALKSPAQLRETLEPLMPGKTKKDRTEAAREEIGKFTDKTSSGTTLAREDDKREGVITTGAAIATLAEKLKLLQG